MSPLTVEVSSIDDWNVRVDLFKEDAKIMSCLVVGRHKFWGDPNLRAGRGTQWGQILFRVIDGRWLGLGVVLFLFAHKWCLFRAISIRFRSLVSQAHLYPRHRSSTRQRRH